MEARPEGGGTAHDTQNRDTDSGQTAAKLDKPNSSREVRNRRGDHTHTHAERT